MVPDAAEFLEESARQGKARTEAPAGMTENTNHGLVTKGTG